MHLRVSVAGLSEVQWARLHEVTLAEYVIYPTTTEVWVQFECPGAGNVVRELVMPFWELVRIVAVLDLADTDERAIDLGRSLLAQAALTSDVPDLPEAQR